MLNRGNDLTLLIAVLFTTSIQECNFNRSTEITAMNNTTTFDLSLWEPRSNGDCLSEPTTSATTLSKVSTLTCTWLKVLKLVKLKHFLPQPECSDCWSNEQSTIHCGVHVRTIIWSFRCNEPEKDVQEDDSVLQHFRDRCFDCSWCGSCNCSDNFGKIFRAWIKTPRLVFKVLNHC